MAMTVLSLCLQNQLYAQSQIEKLPTIEIAKILNSFEGFWKYWNQYVKLSEEFIALDTNFIPCSKNEFLKSISAGQYLPVHLKSETINTYSLYKIDSIRNNEIYKTLKNVGSTKYFQYQMENKPLPHYNFKDLNGFKYNSKTTNGKIVVIKCWFIKCAKCEEERPLVNKLIKTFKNNKNILFTSLAFEKAKELIQFGKTHPVNYSIIPDKSDYLLNTLKLAGYPTYIIIDEIGNVNKVVDSYAEMEVALKTLVKYYKSIKNMPPPPPPF